MRKSILRQIVAAMLAGTLALFLPGCGTSVKAPSGPATELGKVIAVSREEGSGTRMDFEALVGTAGGGTTETANSTDEMVASVAADQNAVGYLAMEALSGAGAAAAGVHAVSIGGVTASTQMILSRRYPLCRSYYLAYDAELSPVESDFLNFVLTAGQTCVARYAVSARVPDTFLSDGSAGEITLNGSSSATTIVEALAREYMRRNPAASVTVIPTDSTEGLAAVQRGECSFAVSSRKLETDEAAQLKTAEIAVDGIAVIVNDENPVTELSLEQVQGLYEGTISDWSELAS